MTQANYGYTMAKRGLIGFDRVFELLENSAVSSNYPPYNIIKTGDDTYAIEVAVAGFSKDDITVEINQDRLRIHGKVTRSDEGYSYIHKGLAFREFKREFNLTEFIEITKVSMPNGLLVIDLRRVIPESLKPRRIEIE